MKKNLILVCAVALVALAPAAFAQSPIADDPDLQEFVDTEIRGEMLEFIQKAPAEHLAAMLTRATQCQSLAHLLLRMNQAADGLPDTVAERLNGILDAKAPATPDEPVGVASAASDWMCRTWMDKADSCWMEYNQCVDNNPETWETNCQTIRVRCEMWEGLVDDFCDWGGWPPDY